MRKLGFVIGIIVLLMAVMPVSDGLPAQAAEPPPPVPQEAPRLPPPQEPPPVIDGHGTGFIPPAMDLSHITGQRMPDGSLVGESPVAAPPAAFDWRNPPNGTNKVTPVWNQGGCGSCYAFAALGNVESKVLIDTNTTPPGPDYSENNSKECNWRELNNFQNPPGTPWGSCSGGNYKMLASLYSQKGVVLETCDPYVPVDVACNPSCPYNKTLLDWRIISGDAIPNTNVLKTYIQTYGPVYTTLWVDGAYGFDGSYDGSYTFNWTAGFNATNHAVLIVGWSNNLPPDQVTGLTGDGWIVKNSWGAGWGAAGYFYIHYGAANIGRWSSFMHSWQDYDNNGGIMYYDDDCWDQNWGFIPPWNSTTAWGLCNFTPANNTYATRVEFWTTDATTDIAVYIYDDFNGTHLSNLLVSQFNYSFVETGYHGVNLTSPLPLTAGDPVIVVVKFTNSVSEFPIPADPNGPNVTGLTYMSPNGANGMWLDMGASLAQDGCIRLRTSTLAINCTCGDICVNTTGWWRNGGVFSASATPIQSAVNNATGGDTICVKDGTYHENIDVNTANLTIKSQNGTANCVVNASNSNDYVFYVTANWVNITGFTVENATGGSRAGICLGSGVSHCNISSNNATNNYYGIYLWSSSNNMLTDNTANSNNFYSIYLSSSSNNTLINNTASHNNVTYGIYLASSNNNTLQNNDGEDNLMGIRLSLSSNNTLDNNTVNSNNYGIYLSSSSSNNNLTNNTANLNGQIGIYLSSSNNNTLRDNTANSNNYDGIFLENSDYNKLVNNTATGHTVPGSFDVFILNSGDWGQQGETGFYDYETRQLALNHDAGNLDLRLSQHGHDAAYVDYVALMKDDTIYLPASAINIDNGVNVLDKVISPEYDVCNAWNSTLEITWSDVPANTTLVMRAMEQDLGKGHGSPLYYPLLREGYTLSHTLIDDGGIAVDGYLEESGEPDFSVFWKPDSPHPDGYTDGWLHADNQYLYAAVEVTSDNTPDDEDWGAIYVMVNGELQEFRVSSAETEWGVSGFQYTSSVPYEHRIYEFAVPLGEINAGTGDKIGYGFGAYGTVTSFYSGITLLSSGNNTLSDNTLRNNDRGVHLMSSNDNTIYNNYFNNTVNAWDNGNNTWNTTNSTGPNIVWGPYIGGNYWSDYSGNDTTGDGFGDTERPYNCTGNITNGGDYLPLILTGATLEGHVSFSMVASGPKWVRGLNVSFFANATQNETGWSPMNATTNNTGVFNISGLAPGTYDIGIKNWTSLSEMNMSVTLTAGNTTVVEFDTPLEGDCNDNDHVAYSDFIDFVLHYDTYYDPANFDRTAKVGYGDYITLLLNYDNKGDVRRYTT